MLRTIALWTAAALAALAQSRAKPSDFPASAHLRDRSLGAEFLAHSVPAPGGVLFAASHLVIEVGLFPGADPRAVRLAPEQFTLIRNGARIPLLPDSAGAVAAAMRESPYAPHLEADASINNAGVVLGRRRAETGVPDLDARRRGPAAPRAPEGPDRANLPARAPLDPRAELERAALPRCECKPPVAGLLYFPYSGKLKSIKSLVLRYAPDDDGPAVDLRLVP